MLETSGRPVVVAFEFRRRQRGGVYLIAACAHDCPAALTSSESCEITVSFLPTQPLEYTDTISVATFSVALSGSGVGHADFELSKTSVSFGDVYLDEIKTDTFAVTHNCPTSLLVDQICTVTVKFTPTVVDSYSISAPIGSASVAMSGQGKAFVLEDVAAGVHGGNTMVFARKPDGTWWATGAQGWGGLGLGDTTQRLSYTRVTALDGATKVVVGGYHTFARKADGTWMATGRNTYGALGSATTPIACHSHRCRRSAASQA